MKCCLLRIGFALALAIGTSAFGQTNYCTNAFPLVSGTNYSFDTSGVSNGVPSIVCGFGVSHGVWFSVTPTNNQRVTISTCGSGYSTVLSVYTNCSLGGATNYDGSLVCSGSVDPFGCGRPGVSFDGVSNVMYYVLVGGQFNQAGLLKIEANLLPLLGNDSCAN